MNLKVTDNVTKVALGNTTFLRIDTEYDTGFKDHRGNNYAAAKVGFPVNFNKDTTVLAWYEDDSYGQITIGPSMGTQDRTFEIIGFDYSAYASMYYYFVKRSDENADTDEPIIAVFANDLLSNTNVYTGTTESPVRIGDKEVTSIGIGDVKFLGIGKEYDDGTFDDFTGNNYLKSKCGYTFRLAKDRDNIVAHFYTSNAMPVITLFADSGELFTITGEILSHDSNGYSPLFWVVNHGEGSADLLIKDEDMNNGIDWVYTGGG